MALNITNIESRFSELLNSPPISFTVEGLTGSFVGARTAKKSDYKFSDYGRDANYSFSILTKSSNFSSDLIDKVVTLSGKNYRVLNTATDAAGVSLRIDLGGEFS